jgi:predicted lipoprotein with Yx(FWY)xxD motif
MQIQNLITTGFAVALAAVSLNACATSGYAESAASPTKTMHTLQGQVWTTATGNTLYTFAKDKAGESSCYNKCAQLWPPYLADGETASAEFSTLQRKDGSHQWALNGAPLYTWVKDANAGDTTGHGVKNVWFVARADQVPVKVYANDNARLLTDLQQLTLYTFDKDADGQSSCNGECAAKWPPLMADSDAKNSPPFSLVTRDDGGRQWARDGQPLYRWVKDSKPGDITGDGIKGVWHVVNVN